MRIRCVKHEMKVASINVYQAQFISGKLMQIRVRTCRRIIAHEERSVLDQITTDR